MYINMIKIFFVYAEKIMRHFVGEKLVRRPCICREIVLIYKYKIEQMFAYLAEAVKSAACVFV